MAILDDIAGTPYLAYGLVLLDNSYTGPCIRVRRSTDNAEQDIGFVDGVVDWADAISFKGAGSLFVVTWYDQTGNTRHATQATAGEQPDLDTAEESVKFGTGNADTFLDLPNLSALTQGEGFFYRKVDADPSAGAPDGNGGIWLFGTDALLDVVPFIDSNLYDGFGSTARKATSVNPTPSMTNYHVYGAYSVSSDWANYLDGVQLFQTGTNTVGFSTTPQLGAGSSSIFMEGYGRAFVLLNAKASSGDRTILSDLDNYISAPTITTTTLPDGVEGSTYSQQLNATGGVGSLEWSAISGLPAGWTVSSSGLVESNGTITENDIGSYSITVEVEDDNLATDQQVIALEIVAAITTVWSRMPLVPRTNMIAWHHYDTTYSADGAIYDFSGNGDHLAGSSPTLVEDVLNGQPGWYFSGSDTPLLAAGSFTVKHGFILVSMDDANFSVQRGLLTGETSGVALAGDNGTTEFIEQTFTGYKKSGVSYSTNDRQSPVSGKFALIEFRHATGIAMDGIQIGQYLANTSQRWKGYFVEDMLFSEELTDLEVEAVYLYYAMRYRLFDNASESIDLYFPSDDIVDIRRNRFFEAPPDFDAITDDFEFADGGRTFNEVGDDAPQSWEYMWTGLSPEEQSIFREFYKAARKVQPFFFRVPDGTVYEDVRCDAFEAPHTAHQSWVREALFNLIKYP